MWLTTADSLEANNGWVEHNMAIRGGKTGLWDLTEAEMNICHSFGSSVHPAHSSLSAFGRWDKNSTEFFLR